MKNCEGIWERSGDEMRDLVNDKDDEGKESLDLEEEKWRRWEVEIWVWREEVIVVVVVLSVRDMCFVIWSDLWFLLGLGLRVWLNGDWYCYVVGRIWFEGFWGLFYFIKK